MLYAPFFFDNSSLFIYIKAINKEARRQRINSAKESLEQTSMHNLKPKHAELPDSKQLILSHLDPNIKPNYSITEQVLL